jgi:Fe-S-cluster containining protein
MLTEDGKCSVYMKRPLICNIKMGGVVLGLDQQEWYQLNMMGCNQMIEEAGLDPSFLVSLEK